MKYPEVSRRFTALLRLRGLKQQDLADLTGINKASISQYINGSHCPSNKKAKLLGEVLHVNPLYLMDLSDNIEEESLYYNNSDTKMIAQEIFENKELRLLFDAAKDAAPEDLKTVHTMLMALKSKEGT